MLDEKHTSEWCILGTSVKGATHELSGSQTRMLSVGEGIWLERNMVLPGYSV